jgi:hypothetical protein
LRVERSKRRILPVAATRSEGVGGRNVREADDVAGMTFEDVQELFSVGVRHSDALVAAAREDTTLG